MFYFLGGHSFVSYFARLNELLERKIMLKLRVGNDKIDQGNG